MSDGNEIEGNNDDLSGKGFVTVPKIYLPAGGGVHPGFTFYASTHVLLPHVGWMLEFFRDADDALLKRYSGGPGLRSVTFEVPNELPFATGIYCKFRYLESSTSEYSDWATSHLFRIIGSNPNPLKPPTISNPGVVRTPRPTISGTGAPRAVVELVEAGVGTIVFATKQADSLGKWSTELTESLWMADPFMMTARQTLNGEVSDWAVPESFTVLFKPVIVSFSVSPDRIVTASGTDGLKGAELQILHSAHPTYYPLLTKTLDSHGAWSVTGTSAWPPGEYTVTAKQSVRGESSDLAVAKAFLIKPDRPTITSVEFDSISIVRGTVGHKGARLVVRRSGGVPLSKTLQSDGIWWVSENALWSPGKHDLTAIQYVGIAESDPSVVFTVAVKPPPPVIRQPPIPAAEKQALAITGVSYGTVTLQMFTEADAPVAGRFTGSSVAPTFIPDPDWVTGTTNVKVVQTVGGVASDPSALVTVAVKPPKPAIDAPPNPAAADQALTITGVFDSDAIILQMFTESGVPVAGRFTGSETTRTFLPAEDWAIGFTRVRVVQTMGGVASEPSVPINVWVNTPKPLIESPPNPAAVKQTLIVTGVMPNADRLEIFVSNSRVTGNFTGSGERRTFTPSNNWAVGANKVTARQSVNDRLSELSDPVTVLVKPPAPSINQPPNPAAENQALTVTGVLSSTRTLQMFTDANAPVAGEFTDSGDTRTFTPTSNWALGSTTVKVVQTVNSADSDASEPVTLRVKPLAPQITTPKEGESYVALQVQGTCEPGATVTVWSGGTDLGPVQVTGTSWTNDFTWQPGPKVVQARQAVAGQDSPDTGVINFKIKPPKPMISPPPDPAAADEALMITGVWEGSVNLAMFTEANHPVAGDFSDGGTSRTFTPLDDWAPGINTVKVVQTVNTVASDPSDECTFSVEVGEKPEAPQFLLPMPGARTSTRPTIKVRGLAGALHTVRLEEGATLHEHNADVDGILEFTVETPLTPGTNVLQVRQKAGGPVSEWSGPHRFTVKELPQKPNIEAPGEGSNASRTPTIRGKGETRGEIVLRHADPEKLIDTIRGVTQWNWAAKELWPIGEYSVEVQQTDEGDSSGWSGARTFKVVESLYGIGDSTPVLANPVVGSGQSVKLRVQVLSGNSGEAAEGVAVQWRLNGQEDILDTTVTDSDGWAYYAYTPETVGKSEVVADITNDNDGVVMTQLYEVNARLHDDWKPHVGLYLDSWPVNLAKSDLVLVTGRHSVLRFVLKSNLLRGSTVTLQDAWGAAERGLTFAPELGTPQKVEEASVSWSITVAEGHSGFFGLRLTSSVLPDWQLPGQVIAVDLAQSVDVDLDAFPQVFGGKAAYLCLGATHTLTVRPKPDSLLLHHPVRLDLNHEAADLGVTVSPSGYYRPLDENGLSWSLHCANSSKSGNFVLRLISDLWGTKVPGMPISLGHNKVEITERDGPSQIDGRWRYGIRVTSAFSGQPAGDVAVTVSVSGSEDVQRSTQSDGWIYVYYDDGQVVSFTIHNGYDGTTVTG